MWICRDHGSTSPLQGGQTGSGSSFGRVLFEGDGAKLGVMGGYEVITRARVCQTSEFK